MNPWTIYQGSDGSATKALYSELERRGLVGMLALNLFRAQKASSRAKIYRGGVRGQGSYKAMAYERKQWSLDNLVSLLDRHSEALKVRWGWRIDYQVLLGSSPAAVLYIELPDTGRQVSFHSPRRGKGPEYPGDWDGERASAERIIGFCSRVLELQPTVANQEEQHATS